MILRPSARPARGREHEVETGARLLMRTSSSRKITSSQVRAE